MITEKMTLADVVRDYPQTIPYLNELHLDYCCGGHEAIVNLVKEKDLDEAKLLKELNDIASRPAQNSQSGEDIEAFEKLSIPEMIDSLEATHHVTERKMMDEVEVGLNRMLLAHYANHGKEITWLHHQFALLKADLEEHFAKEERFTFPHMKAHMQPSAEDIAYVKELEDEHTAAGDIIKAIEEETHQFTLPDDACNTYKYTFQVMQQLFKDIFIHIFKENSVLFPEYDELGE
ncbi:MAG: DUF542 domain-containing protein [Pseudoramibacter sp.]